MSRLNLQLSRPTHERLQDLLKKTDASSMADVIRQALNLYATVIEHKESGGEIIVKKDNEETKLVIL